MPKILELAPGLPIVTYQTVDLPASKQAIELDSLPLGATLVSESITSDMLWDDNSQILWDDGSAILWGPATIVPSSVDLKG